MTVDRAWFKRNVGFDPIETPAPLSTFKIKEAATPNADIDDVRREMIEFDSEGPEGISLMTFSKATGLSAFTDIAWPNGLEPKTDTTLAKTEGGRLPKADVLVVTWTVDEGHATSRVLTPGKDSRNDYKSYSRNFDTIAKKFRKGAPALEANRLGAYWTTSINGKSVVVFKSDSHLSQDTIKVAPKAGETLPNEDVWAQIVDDVQPTLVITTGTGGGIGKTCEVGDVCVSPIVRFVSESWLRKASFHDAIFKTEKPKTKLFARAQKLFKANAHQLPPDNDRPPRILHTTGPSTSVATTDLFGFDTSDNHFKLQGTGLISEMGDAILGMLIQKRKDAGLPTPRWVAVRNVSDPQIKAEGSLKEQADLAGQIYKTFGRWSTICSAIVCWALIAAE